MRADDPNAMGTKNKQVPHLSGNSWFPTNICQWTPTAMLRSASPPCECTVCHLWRGCARQAHLLVRLMPCVLLAAQRQMVGPAVGNVDGIAGERRRFENRRLQYATCNMHRCSLQHMKQAMQPAATQQHPRCTVHGACDVGVVSSARGRCEPPVPRQPSGTGACRPRPRPTGTARTYCGRARVRVCATAAPRLKAHFRRGSTAGLRCMRPWPSTVQ